MFVINDLAGAFPGLKTAKFLRTSEPTSDYNCVAWVFSERHRWWEPDPFGFSYWPPGIPRAYGLQSYLRMFGSHGFARCKLNDNEAGSEKIAIYSVGAEFKHVARHVENDNWTSKLGSADDITHELASICCDSYGTPTVFMKRKQALSLP